MASWRQCWKIGWIALLAIPGLLLAQSNPPPASTTAGQAATFDRILQRVVGPESLESSTDAYEADLERLRVLLPAGDTAREVQFRSIYCGSTRWKNPQQGLAFADVALKRARDARDVASEARAMLCRATYIMLISGSKRGAPEVEGAIALLRDTEEQQLLAEALEMRGDIASLLGEQASAMLDFQRARAAYRASGIDREVEPLMLSIAVAYRRMGDWPQAERHFTNAIKRIQDKNNWKSVATNLIQLGFLYIKSDTPNKTLASFQNTKKIAAALLDLGGAWQVG